jgi:hypothetical protein
VTIRTPVDLKRKTDWKSVLYRKSEIDRTDEDSVSSAA